MESFGELLIEDGGTGRSSHNVCGSRARLQGAYSALVSNLKGLNMADFRAEDTIFFPETEQSISPPPVEVPAVVEDTRPAPAPIMVPTATLWPSYSSLAYSGVGSSQHRGQKRKKGKKARR